MDKETFVTTYLPLAQKAGVRFGMNPAVILAQAAIESGWGSSYGARVRKNFFGITAAGSPNEFWDGSFSVGQNQATIPETIKAPMERPAGDWITASPFFLRCH